MSPQKLTHLHTSLFPGYDTAPAVGCTVSFCISDCRKTGSVATVELPIRLREEPRGAGRSHPRKVCGDSRMVTITPPRPIQPVLVAPVISNSVVRQDKMPSTVKTTQHQHTACQYGLVTQHTVIAMMSPHTVTVPNNLILRSVALGNAGRQLAKHKQVYKWAAERVLNRTDIQWSRSRMPTLASLEDVQHLLSPDVREAVLTKFTAGTVLESAKGGPLILGYDCDDMSTLATLTDFLQHKDCLPPSPKLHARTMTATGEDGPPFAWLCANPLQSCQRISKY